MTRPSAAPEGPKSGEAPVAKGAFPTVGTVVGGKYLIEKIIGEGGVGIVVAAQNVELGERVALKFLRAEMLDQPEIVGRFLVEAKAACSIKSEHSASVFDVGRTPEGIPFLVMEFLAGEDLASVIEAGHRLQVRDVAEYGMQVCDALAVAHAQGIVHRDIKPENLFLETRSGMRAIKVLDFGISKTALTGSVLSTVLPLMKTVNLMGTPLYMSPEQVRHPDRVDPRTDIWSLGVVMFEALAGTLPLRADSITELCAAILESPLDSLLQYRQDLPEGFVDVVEKCLEKDVSRRYQSVAEVALALMPFAPKRARICAERAAQVLVSAGLIAEETVRFPSAIPPSFSTGPYPAAPSSGPVPAFGSGSFALAPPPPISTPSFAVSSEHPAASSNVTLTRAEVALSPRRRKRKVAAFLVVIALLALAAGGAAVFQGRFARRPAPTANEVSTAPAPPPPITIARTAEPAPIDTAPKVAAASTSAPVRPHVKAGVPAYVPPPLPLVRPKATASPASAPPAPVKKSDSLDIGY